MSIVASWNLDGNSNDSVNGNNGTDTAITYSQAKGKFNSGAGFNGSTSKIISTSAQLKIAGALSLSLWLRVDALPAAYNAIAGESLSGYARGFLLDMGRTGMTFYIGNGTWAGVDIIKMYVGKWVKIDGTWDGTTIKAYHNGNFIGSASKSSIDYTGCGFSMGQYYNHPNSNNTLNGAIDKVRLYNNALTTAFIKNKYSAEKGFY